MSNHEILADSFDKAIQGLGYGCSIRLLRGAEWVLLWLDRETNFVVWSYGKGKVGDGRKISPLSVIKSQMAAHCSKGWILDPGFYW